jgi:hypothetical protein
MLKFLIIFVGIWVVGLLIGVAVYEWQFMKAIEKHRANNESISRNADRK